MKPNPALSIVIPVYNSAETIREVVAQISRLQVEGGHELILVNDNSPDNSLAICLELAKTCSIALTVVDLARNFGEHNAVMAGLQQAHGDYVVTMDDDLQNPPEEAVRLFNYTRSNNFDVVWTYYAKKQHALWRNLGSALTNRVADVLLEKPKNLYLSSFRCMSRFVAQQITEYRGPFPYIDGLILRATHKFGQLEVAHAARAKRIQPAKAGPALAEYVCQFFDHAAAAGDRLRPAHGRGRISERD
jgi:glycosyltransferase involved in cell wall biosynthesis